MIAGSLGERIDPPILIGWAVNTNNVLIPFD
jgi:hypothetical protein